MHSPSLQRLLREDAVGQLWRREGRMVTSGSEDGAPKLDWVYGVERLLAHPDWLAAVETEARQLWVRGIRHIIWAGMGGSIIAVRVLVNLGFCDGHEAGHFTIHPLDSTDPAALNAIVRDIARVKNLSLPDQPAQPSAGNAVSADFLHDLLTDVMMVGVSMGMTSEEPITHLEWFTDLLSRARMSPAEHLLVMTLPGSYLDQFARRHAVPTRALQLDGGNGTGGRMSAPTTRVFLLPAAFYLTRAAHENGQLLSVLRRAWHEYAFPLTEQQAENAPFVRLAAALSDASVNGACRMMLRLPGKWSALLPWIEQLMEESLGKGGKGIVVFDDQSFRPVSPDSQTDEADGSVRVRVVTAPVEDEQPHAYYLVQPHLLEVVSSELLSAAAASFLGWQLVMALYGYLQDIHFAGQPAVENYKARARVLRSRANPLEAIQDWQASASEGPITLYAPSDVDTQGSPANVFARSLRRTASRTADRLSYLDVTINGEAAPALWSLVNTHVRHVGNDVLHVPVKLRDAPASYHSTEQSEMDGPPDLISLRLLARQHEPSIIGAYTDTFLCAQAVSTWQAMIEQGRVCFLLLYDGLFDETALPPLRTFFEAVARYVENG